MTETSDSGVSAETQKEFDEWLNRYMNAWSAELEIEMHAEETRETDKAKE